MTDGAGSPGSQYTAGAGHGGQGALANFPTGHGSTIKPIDFGSGVSSTHSTLRGGGRISITAHQAITVDGTISAAGDSSSGSTGGGAGGSLLIETAMLRGHGLLSVNGGSGINCNCGGGGGGRMAIYADDMSDFAGSCTSYGGTGQAANGGAGTVYIRAYEVGLLTESLIIDNNNLNTDSYTVLISNAEEVLIDKLIIQNRGRLKVASTDHTTISLSLVIGDMTGTILVQTDQTLSVARKQGISSFYYLQSALTIQDGGEVILPASLYIPSVSNGLPTLDLAGIISGTSELIVGAYSLIKIESTARTAGISNGEYTFIDPPGTLTLDSLQVLGHGVMELDSSTEKPATLNILDDLHIRFGGILKSEWLVVEAKQVHVEYSGRIHSDGLGFGPGEGEGRGTSNPSGSASGASHGGKGGDASSGTKPGVLSYGTLYDTNDFGSGGGRGSSGTPGSGGGVVTIKAAHLRLDGIISSSGSGASGVSGGGSGGAVHLTLQESFTGSGKIMSSGGQGGSSGGGGGGGGRISLYILSASHFDGEYVVYGGTASGGNQPGGSGTMYKIQTVDTTEHTILYINNNNPGITTAVITQLDEPRGSQYSFDELHVLHDVILEIAGDDAFLIAASLFSETSSVIRIHNGMIMSVADGVSEAVFACSFEVDSQGELRLPETVTFNGPNNILSGKFLYIHTFYPKI